MKFSEEYCFHGKNQTNSFFVIISVLIGLLNGVLDIVLAFLRINGVWPSSTIATWILLVVFFSVFILSIARLFQYKDFVVPMKTYISWGATILITTLSMRWIVACVKVLL